MAYVEDTNLIEEIKSLKISVGGKDVFPDEAKESVLRVISEQPTADVAEVKHGEWIDKWGGKYANPTYICSVCGEKALLECYINELNQCKYRQSLSIRCPHCGAKMDDMPQNENVASRNKECTECKHFLGCECFSGKVCEQFEAVTQSEKGE